MRFRQYGQISVTGLEPADLTSQSALERVRVALDVFDGRADVAALVLDLTDAAGVGILPDMGLAELCDVVDGAPIPIVAALAGPLGGAALALALACDYRLAAGDLRVACFEALMGRLPQAGVVPRLVRAAGSETARLLLVEGADLTAAEAVECGLCDGAPRGDPVMASVALCRRLIKHAVGPRDPSPPNTGSELRPPHGDPRDLARLAAVAIDAARVRPLPEAVAIAAALDARLAQGAQARALAHLAECEIRERWPFDVPGAPRPIAGVQVSGGGGDDLIEALRAAGCPVDTHPRPPQAPGSLAPGEIGLHISEGETKGVLICATGLRVPLAFAGPTPRPSLIEIGSGPVAARAMAYSMAVLVAAQPIDVPAGPGLAEALHDAALDMAERLLEGGARPDMVDSVLEAQGWVTGPFRMADRVGHLQRLARRAAQSRRRDPRQHYPVLVDRLCAMGRIGGREAAGWYERDGTPAALPGLLGSRGAPPTPEEIGTAMHVALRLAGWRLVTHFEPEAIDLAAVHGLGLPRWDGGLFAGTAPDALEAARRDFARSDPVFWAQPPALGRLLRCPHAAEG